MARQARAKMPGAACCYHVVSRANGQEFKLDEGNMKDVFMKYLKKLTQKLFYARIVSFTCLSNHFHLVVNMLDPEDVDEKEAIKRWNEYHEKAYQRNPDFKSHREYVVKQLTDISSFIKRLKMHLTIEYNKLTETTGTMWDRRFYSGILQRGYAVAVCSAYVDLNSFRAGIVKKPEDYQYSSLHELEKGNREDLVEVPLLAEGLDMGDFARYLADEKTLFKKVQQTYKAFVYKAGLQPHRDEDEDEERKGLVITHEMFAKIEKEVLGIDEGIFVKRQEMFTEGKSLGSPEFAEQFYDNHIAK